MGNRSRLLVTAALFINAGVIYSQNSAAILERSNVLVSSNEARLSTISKANISAFVSVIGELELAVMDFNEPMSLDPPPEGWWHRKIPVDAAMDMSFGFIEGDHALRLATENSAHMLLRFVDIDLERYPLLAWRWLIENPIETDIDELTRAGDDHPARLIISFRTVDNQERAMEIIWGNELVTGNYKYIDNLPHYVANGGNDTVGYWYEEEINLLGIYRELWPDDQSTSRITEIGLKGDSDDTNDDSVAWFSYIRLKQQIDILEPFIDH